MKTLQVVAHCHKDNTGSYTTLEDVTGRYTPSGDLTRSCTSSQRRYKQFHIDVKPFQVGTYRLKILQAVTYQKTLQVL